MRLMLLALAVSPVLVGTAPAQVVPAGFTIETLVTSGLTTPTDFCFLPDGRCLIANVAGAVSLYAGTSSTAVTIGTVPNVEVGTERGLLSIAADPSFAANGFLYVYYSSTVDAFLHLDRFTCTGDLSNPSSTQLQFVAASRCVVLGAIPDNLVNHNGGSVRFGPDGMLYLSIGDDTWGCDAQMLTSQAGCLLRMNVNALPPGPSTTLPAYSALDPGNNPLSANSDFSQLLIAHGLRNPFRVEVDPVTGSLYIGDVGELTVEELSEYVYPGAGPLPLVNFGWPWREGNISGYTCQGTQPANLVPPIAWETHAGGWLTAMAGPLYRNLGGPHDFGPTYEGSVFFFDFYAGQVRRFVRTAGWQPAPAVPGQPDATNWGTGFVFVSGMRLGPDGALWFSNHSPNLLRRVRPLGPVASISAISGSGQRGPAGEAFSQPLVVRVLNAQGGPLAGGLVDFAMVQPG